VVAKILVPKHLATNFSVSRNLMTKKVIVKFVVESLIPHL